MLNQNLQYNILWCFFLHPLTDNMFQLWSSSYVHTSMKKANFKVQQYSLHRSSFYRKNKTAIIFLLLNSFPDEICNYSVSEILEIWGVIHAIFYAYMYSFLNNARELRVYIYLQNRFQNILLHCENVLSGYITICN